jgi:hypothetical protein
MLQMLCLYIYFIFESIRLHLIQSVLWAEFNFEQDHIGTVIIFFEQFRSTRNDT